jgi:hypothetical protein
MFLQSLGRSHLTKLTTVSGVVVASKPAGLSEVKDFFGGLYASHASGLTFFNAVLFEWRTPKA